MFFDCKKVARSLGMSAIEPLRFRIDVDTTANINARISHLAEGETASLKNAHAAAGAAASRQRAADELLSGEIPEGHKTAKRLRPPAQGCRFGYPGIMNEKDYP